MVSQANSEASSSRSQSVHFTPSTTHVFGASSTPASRRLSEIRQFRGASTQPGSEPSRPARPRFFSSPGREDNSHPSPQFSRRPRSQLSSSVRPTFSTRASPEKSFQAETSFYTPCPPSRRRESVSWKRPQTSEPRAGGLFDNLPSRPAPKRRNLFGTSSSSGSMGDSTPTSQQGTGSQTPPTPASLSRSSYSYSFQPSRASSRTLSPEKRESPAPSRSATVVETPKCYIDPDGDLCLEVGFVAAKFVVDSKILARASPAWKKLLDSEGKKLEQTRGGGKLERVLKLPDDNNSAMEIFLNIVHGRFDRVSGYDEFVYCVYFYSLCVLTHKYDMTRILRPWAKGWSRTVHANCDKLGDSLRTKFCHERLWIAWELGDQVTFEEIAKTLLLESSSEPGYNLKYVGAVEPPEIYGNIKGTRLYVIDSLLSAARQIIEGLIQNSDTPAQCPEGKADCVPSMLGKAIRSLHGVDLWPLPEPRAVECSVTTLAKNLRSVAFGDAAPYHACSKRFEGVLGERVDAILKDIPSMLTKTHHLHLADRAEKAGFVQTLAAKP